MRLLFLILIPITFLFIVIAPSDQVSASGPATIFVCPTLTPTCVCSSLAQAVQTLTATTTPGTIQLNTMITAAQSVNTTAYDTLIFGGGMGVSTTGGSGALNFTSAPAFPMTILGLGNNKITTDGTIVPLRIGTFSAGFSLMVSNMSVSSPGAAAAVSISSVLNAANILNLDRCKLYSLTGNGLDLHSLVITAHAIKVTNSTLTAPGGTGYIDSTAVSSNDIIDWDHDTFSGCVTGYTAKSGEAVTNSLFVNNTVDLGLTAPATVLDFNFCQFGQQASGGTSCLYGATLANVFCDQTNGYLGPQNPGRNAGTATGLIGQPSLSGILWRTGFNSPGATAYSLGWCGGYGVGK